MLFVSLHFAFIHLGAWLVDIRKLTHFISQVLKGNKRNTSLP